MSDPERTPDLRISDAERHAVAEQLREAAAVGRLELEELEERLEATYAARTYADLVPLTQDLPSVPGSFHAPTRVPARAVERTPSTTPEWHLAVMGGFERKGVWTVPPTMVVACLMGGAEIDLREARWATDECVMWVSAVMGGATVIVGPDVEVVLEGIGIMGGYGAPSDKAPAELGPGSPVLRVRGIAFWGAVSVERRPRLDGASGDRKPRRLR